MKKPNLIIISYDLRTSERQYNNVYKYISSFPQFRRVTESTWAVLSTKSCNTIHSEMSRIIGRNDRLFITTSTGEISSYNIL